MIATKEQERKALEQIKKIVDGLGEDSYIRTAFEGAFEDAENNIKDDAAYSMKARYEFSEKQLEKALEENKQLKEKLAESEKEVNSLKNRVILDNDITVISQLIANRISATELDIKNAADRIVGSATEPESAMFKNAVKEHRFLETEMNRYAELLKRVSRAKPE